MEPTATIIDLQAALLQLQKRVALLDTAKIEAISRRVQVVMGDVDAMLIKKPEENAKESAHDDQADHKVGELYESCHRWNATSAGLPYLVARLQSLKGVHEQSASFGQRLCQLEQQQEELAKLLEVTNSTVLELGASLQDNMLVMAENMQSLEAKIARHRK